MSLPYFTKICSILSVIRLANREQIRFSPCCRALHFKKYFSNVLYEKKHVHYIIQVCIKQNSVSNLELRISYGYGLSSPMCDVWRFDRLFTSSSSDAICSSEVSVDADLTFRAKLLNVSAMSSNLGNSKQLQRWTTQYIQQVSKTSRGKCMPRVTDETTSSNSTVCTAATSCTKKTKQNNYHHRSFHNQI